MNKLKEYNSESTTTADEKAAIADAFADNDIIEQIELWIKADIISFDDLEGLAASAYAYEAAKDANDE